MSLSVNVALLGQQGSPTPTALSRALQFSRVPPQAIRLLQRVRRATGLASVMNC